MSTAVTRAQARQLSFLLSLSASSRETAVSIYQHSGLTVAGLASIREVGLASSAVERRPGGKSQFTVYWLTEAGLKLARSSSDKPAGRR